MGPISICRLCLNSDRRTCFINDTVLQETWEKLADVRIDSNDRRPLLACYICCAQLRNSHLLRQRALKSQELFTKYIVNNDFEDSKKLVSLIVSKTYDIDYNYAFEEQYNLECIQKDPNAVEVKQEIQDEEDIDNKEFGGKLFVYTYETVAAEEELKEDEIIFPKEEIQDITDYEDAKSDIDNLGTGTQSESEEDPLGNNVMGEMVQKEVQVLLETTDTGVTAKKFKVENEAIEERRPWNNTTTSLLKEMCNDNGKKSRNLHTNSDLSEHAASSTHDTAYSKNNTNFEVFSCELCPYECFKTKSFNAHLRKYHGRELPYRCNLCDYNTALESTLRSHIMLKHKMKKCYTCDTCRKIYFKRSSLVIHLHEHTGEKPYKCDLCEFKTADSAYLNKHVKLKHTKAYNYPCHICQKKFCDKTYLNVHIRSHSGEKPYKCDMCDYRTGNTCALKQHIKYKHVKEKNYACHTCAKKFVRRCDLERHLHVHNGKKPHECDFCDFKTANKGNLKAHVKYIHTKEKKYMSCLPKEFCY